MKGSAGKGPAPLKRGWYGRAPVKRKREAAVRLLRGEYLEMVSRDMGVTEATLTNWREAFMASGDVAHPLLPTADGRWKIRKK
ncbi:MAG: hypothetical protein JRC92_04650 [Deltaproteobacteria bacterium]|nr:hypothetical protein [Deltaproteobacteria bacterium]